MTSRELRGVAPPSFWDAVDRLSVQEIRILRERLNQRESVIDQKYRSAFERDMM